MHIFGVSRIQSVKNFVICVIEKILIFVTVVFPKIHSCLSVSSGWLTFLNIYNIYIYNIYIIYILHIYIINIYTIYIQEGQYIYIKIQIYFEQNISGTLFYCNLEIKNEIQ